MTRKQNNQSGMALVTVLIFSVVAMIVVTAALSLSINTAQSNQQFIQGQLALNMAESGAENALLRLLRDPSYTGETLTLSDGTATIVATGSATKVIDVTGVSGTAVRKLELTTNTVSGVTTVASWQEVFP